MCTPPAIVPVGPCVCRSYLTQLLLMIWVGAPNLHSPQELASEMIYLFLKDGIGALCGAVKSTRIHF